MFIIRVVKIKKCLKQEIIIKEEKNKPDESHTNKIFYFVSLKKREKQKEKTNKRIIFLYKNNDIRNV